MNALLAADRSAYQAQTRQIHADYLAATETAVADGAKIVVWPEAAGLGLEEDVTALVRAGQSLAQQEEIYLAMPTLTLYPEGERPAENMLQIADPQGEIVLEHIKYGGSLLEGSLAGSGVLQTVETPYGTLSGIICWDTDFPGVVRQAGQQGVDIMLSPSLEWVGIDPLHGEMAAFRAVENGMTVVRQADMGWSVAFDGYGRTLASAETEAPILQVTVPTQGVNTMYARIGDVFGLLAVAGVVVCSVLALVARRRERQAQSATGTPDLAPLPQ
jgi:apolipoprotein N-acyltransferase